MLPAGSSRFSDAQRRLHVRHRQVARRQLAPVQPDTHGIHLAAADAHPCHAIQHREAVHQVAPGIVGQFRDAHVVARQVQPHDHVFVAVFLLDIRRVGLVGQVIEDGGDTVADVIGGGIDIATDVKFHGDARAPVLAAGGNETDPLDARDAVLDELGDAVFHDIGGGTRIAGADGDDRRIDVGVFTQRQAVEGQQPEGDQQQRHDRCKHRPGDRDIGQDHSERPPGNERNSSGSVRLPSSTALMVTAWPGAARA